MAGKGHLRVDPHDLAEAAQALDRMVEEFTHAEDIVDGARDVLGSDDISGALHHFATNWSQKRERICKTIDECAHVLHEGHHAYTRADSKLAGEAHRLVSK